MDVTIYNDPYHMQMYIFLSKEKSILEQKTVAPINFYGFSQVLTLPLSMFSNMHVVRY